MTRTLTDAEWLAIGAAAKLIPDAEARGELSACLFSEYPNMRYDREGVAAALRHWQRVLRHVAALAKLYGCEGSPADPKFILRTYREAVARGDDILRERDLSYLYRLHQRASARVIGCQRIRRANKGHQDPQRAWLVSRLYGIWLINFQGRDLRIEVPVWGGAPRGPLVRYLFAAMRLVVPKSDLPSAWTLADAIRQEQAERENAKQLRLKFIERSKRNI
jgi:hypothetical protein